jgi:hypothetical protein
MNMLTKKINQLITQHGGLRAAARYLGVSAPYLGRLKEGKYDKPSKEILDKLGIERTVLYTVKPRSRK